MPYGIIFKLLYTFSFYSIYNYYDPLYAEGNPVGVKACLALLGICEAVVRPPLIEASSILKDELKELLSL